MIARVWQGRAAVQDSETYRRHFIEGVRPVLSRVHGHRGTLLLRREAEAGSQAEFLAVTMWDSMEAIQGFAGPDPDRAVVDPEARAALAEFDRFVRHYDVVLDTRDRGGSPPP